MQRGSGNPLHDPSAAGREPANPNVAFYEAIAPFYAELYGEIDATETVRQWLLLLEGTGLVPLSQMRQQIRPRLIDIGCGPGWHLAAWDAAGFEVVGLDASPSMLGLAEASFHQATGRNCQLLLADIRCPDSLPPVRPFDVAVSHFNFLNLFPPSERPDVFTGVAKLVRPGGIWITDFAEPLRPPKNVREIVRLGSGAGALKRLGRFDAALRCYRQRWAGPGIDAVEVYWFGCSEQLSAIADQTGWRLLRRCRWTLGRLVRGQRHEQATTETLVDIYRRL